EAVPEPIGVAGPGNERDEPASDAEIALCEVEILESSGPIRKLAAPPPLPAGASASPASPKLARPPPSPAGLPPPVSIFSAPVTPSGTAVPGWRKTAPARTPEAERSARERAVALFDRGLEMRGESHYAEALDAWEKPLALAPDNRVYQANVQRL